MVSRYVTNGPVKQEGICFVPQHPQHFRMYPPPPPQQRTDGYHVATPPTYIQQPPPNQGNNQVPSLRGMPQTGPPNQASTPPSADIKVQMQPQQPSMNLGQQHIFQQPQYLPIMQASVPYLSRPNAYYNGTPQPQPGFVAAAPFQMIPQPTYTYQAPQTQSTTFFYNGPPPTIIQRPPLSSVAVQQNPNQPTATTMTLPALPQQINTLTSKKRPNAIPIIDPTTGKDINEQIYEQDDSHPTSGESSARQTPQPPIHNSGKDIQAEFARQVTEAINVKEVSVPIPILDEFDSPSMLDPTVHMYSLPPQAVPHQRFDSIVQTSKLQVATKEFIPASALNNTAKEITPVVSAITDAVEVTITNKPKDRESPIKSRKPRESTNITIKEAVNVKEKDDVYEKTVIVTVEEIKTKDAVTSLAPIETVVITASDKKIQKKDTQPASTTPVPVVDETKPDDEGVLTDLASDAIATNGKSKQISTKPKDTPKQSQQIIPPPVQHPPPVHHPQPAQYPPQPHVVSTAPLVPAPQKVVVPSAPLPIPATQPTKPNNRTNKLREINMKGAQKEGTDMDAFNDNIEETTITSTDYVNSDYINNDNSTVLNNNEDSNQNNDITTITPIIETKPKSKFDVMDIVKDAPKPIKPIVQPIDEVDRAVAANEKLVQAKNEANAKANAEIIDTNPPETKLNLPYRDDQWSPSNPEGKKVYGYDFLMALKDIPTSKQRPDNIVIPVDIVANDTRGQRVGDINRYPVGGRQTDFAPAFGNNAYANKNSQRGTVVKRKSQQGASSGSSIKAGSRPSVIRVSISVKEDVKLREVENAWRPARLVIGENVTEDEKKTAELYKKVRGVLNKLTPQKFNQLLDQVKTLHIDTTERLQGVIDLVFEKAVDEPNFSVAYANLCKEVSLIQVPTSDSKQREIEGLPTEFVNFRKLLVTRCQLEFEKNSADESERNEKLKEIEICEDAEKKKDMQLELQEYDRRLRMKSVGNIRFIGELFKQNMLTINIMVRCLNNLIANKDEESLECLCKLMSTVGKELEVRKVDLSSIFAVMKDYVDKKHGISSRVRFMIQDVIDLRQSQWVPRRQDFNPKTIDQIQKEADNEQLIQTLNNAPVATPRKDDRIMSGSGGSMHSNDRRGRRNVGSSDDGGWTTTQARGSRSTPFNVVSDKLRTVMPLTDEPLGNSGMFGNWSAGVNVKQPAPLASSNIYSALENLNAETEKRPPAMGMRQHSKDNYHSKGPSLERNYRQSYDDGRGSRSGSQHRSRDSSASHHSTQQSSIPPIPSIPPTFIPPSIPTAVAPNDQPAVVSPAIEMTPDEIRTHLTKILEDYLTDSNVNLCDSDIKKAFPPSELPNVVTEGYSSVLEKNKKVRLCTGQLFAELIKLGTLSVKDYCTGLANILSEANDLIIDIPKLWDYLGELIAPVSCEGVLSMWDLHHCCKILITQNHASKLLVALFNLIIQEKSPNFLHSIWNSSGLSLSNFMPESQVDSFIKHNKFECLLYVDSSSSYNPSFTLTQQDIHNKLVSLFKSNTSFDDTVSWISTHVDTGAMQLPFIRTLATACFEESVVQNRFRFEILKGRLNLIMRYVDAKQDCELQCLFAIQTLVNKLEFPMGLLLAIFDKIYEENMFSYESFVAWEQNTDPAEQEGKGVALKQLTSFFTQLKEADEDTCGSSDETGG